VSFFWFFVFVFCCWVDLRVGGGGGGGLGDRLGLFFVCLCDGEGGWGLYL